MPKKQYMDGYGTLYRWMFDCLREIPKEVLTKQLDAIDHAESIGPLLNPSAWMGQKFEAAQGSKEFLRKIIELKELQDKWAKKVQEDIGLQVELAKGVLNEG